MKKVRQVGYFEEFVTRCMVNKIYIKKKLGVLQNHSRVILDLSTVYASRLTANCMHQDLKMELYVCGRRPSARRMVCGSV